MEHLSKFTKTEPSIFHGLFNNVRFEPWTEFQSIMSEGMQTLAQLEKQKSLHQSSPSSKKSGHVNRDDVIPGRSSHIPGVPSRPLSSIEYIRGLLLREIQFVCNSIDAVLPNTSCKDRDHTISSEQIFRNASNDMIRNFMKTLMQRDENSREGEDPASSIHSQTPNSKAIPTKPVIPLNKVSDKWAFRYCNDMPSEVPVCCYQFEDQGEDITGILPFYRYLYPQDDGESGKSDFDIESGSLEPTPREIYISGASPEQVAAHFNNTLFSSRRDTSEIDDSEQSRKRQISIAQAISRAILTKTGCVYLTNHEMALALQVKEDPTAERFGAKVLVSGAFLPNSKLGRSDAMFSLTKHCFDVDMQSQNDELLDPMRRLIMGFSYSTYNSIDKIVPLHSSWFPGEGPFLPRGQSTQTNSDENKRNDNQGEGSPISTSLRRSDYDKLFWKLFASTKDLLAEGQSGVVVHGTFEGEEVAIKTWNGRSERGFSDLKREIHMYKKIQKICPALLGSVVPTLKVGWDSPSALSVYQKEPVLVTGLMGTEVTRFPNNICVFEEGALWATTDEERDRIRESAMKSLEQLHANGFMHGDIAFRNMRVARNKGITESWDVWWIDLGRTCYEDNLNQGCRDLEMRECKRLFET